MTSTIARNTDQLALSRVKQIVARCQQGSLTPSNALHQIEAYAAALHVALYDLAVDEIEQVALAKALNLEPVPHRVARTRKHFGAESATRRARRHEQKRHRPATPRGTGVEANVAETVRAHSTEWRTAAPAGEVVPLRPIWAVSSDGTVDDGAFVFGTPKGQGLGLLGAAQYQGKTVTPARHHGPTTITRLEARVITTVKAGQPARLREHGTLDTVTIAVERERHSDRAGIIPNLAYRVPSVPAESPLIEAKEQWLAMRRSGQTVKTHQRAAAYRQNGWAH
ncbi:hypothetical protein MINTM005_13090 [Mycobacterium intracellulare]|uniref:hypothetical protein n=1 Tax=Mycobacterium intracellulare TaxID=1767 RepID=UPI001927B471|nr:hypothetical protein [Mycobacterium intracellulare]BCO56065.1 hypothetical protein MINTM005_13090 [Mycobacterium intracellulare]